MKTNFLAIAILTIILPVSAQAATVVTFKDLPTTGPFNGNGTPFTTYTENGIKVSASSRQFLDSTDTGKDDNFSLLTGQFNTKEDALLRIESATAGELFNLGSFDIMTRAVAGSYVVSAYFADGAKAYSFNGVTAGNNAFSTIRNRFGAATSYVTIATDSTDQLFIDNIGGALISATTPAVPEPATWAMMIGGFGVMGATLRRRRRVGAVA